MKRCQVLIERALPLICQSHVKGNEPDTDSPRMRERAGGHEYPRRNALLSKQMVQISGHEGAPPIGGPPLYMRVLEREMGFEPSTLCVTLNR